MSELARTRKEIEAAWRAFVVDGEVPGGVRPVIRRSWERVRRAALVDPALATCPRATAGDDALARADADEAFRVASPLVAEFAGRLAADGHVVGYFDADGVMLALDGNRRTRARLADVNFTPGACWAEDAAGTNGPGTALAEALPVEVFASEHFVEAWQPWTCASVPVRLRGRVLGAVDITSPWRARHPALLATAQALALAIEAQLEARAARRGSRATLDALEDALRARDEFLALASHELKTPLTPLQLDVQGLRRLAATATSAMDPADVVRAVQRVERDVRRVVDRVDDLLEASRLVREPVQLSPEETDLGALVRAVVERHRGDLDQSGCEVTVAVPGGVSGRWDARRLAQAFGHLLVNAMKYAPGRIDIHVQVEASRARLVVRDHGPGIGAEHQERIFAPFERAVSYQNVAGLGLGLHVVRRIVGAHGGEVRLESAAGRGCTFVLELPIDRARPDAAPAADRAPRSAAPRPTPPLTGHAP